MLNRSQFKHLIDECPAARFCRLMKVRDSGMPDVQYWESLFDVPLLLDRMRITAALRDVAEFGAGYGTFTIPAARRISGLVYSFDIEKDLVDVVRERAALEEVRNIRIKERDFLAGGTGLADESVDYAMAFNILHHDRPREILAEAFRILKKGGLAGLVHWRCDIPTPRGPSLAIRPGPDRMAAWAESVGFQAEEIEDLPPYHVGVVAVRP